MSDKEDTPIGISRIDNERNGTHGYLVYLQRRGQIFSKHFSDGICGSRELAYKAACTYRNTVTQNHQGLTRAEYARIVRKNNVSGVPGVCKYGHTHWVAFWPTALGKRKQAKFSIARYGEEHAFALAVAARQRALESLTEPYTRTAKTKSRRRLRAKPIFVIPNPRIRRVAILRYRLRVELHDERVIAVPLSWFPALLKASPENRQQWAISETGDSIVWEKLGLVIAPAQLLRIA
jgi:hypothetical protein